MESFYLNISFQYWRYLVQALFGCFTIRNDPFDIRSVHYWRTLENPPQAKTAV